MPQVNETRLNAQGFLASRRVALDLHAPRLLVEIPANADDMRAYTLRLARRWRMETREIFQCYLAAGYVVKDFLFFTAATERRCFYLLQRPARRS